MSEATTENFVIYPARLLFWNCRNADIHPCICACPAVIHHVCLEYLWCIRADVLYSFAYRFSNLYILCRYGREVLQPTLQAVKQIKRLPPSQSKQEGCNLFFFDGGALYRYTFKFSARPRRRVTHSNLLEIM